MEKRTTMKKELKAKYDAFRKECRDETMFRFALGYLMENGYDRVSSITEEEIENMVKELKEQEEEMSKVTHAFFVMTPDFQGDIVRNAVKLAKTGGWCDLLKYVINEVFIG